MGNCKHDDRFHLMGATNGCCACGFEAARAEVNRLDAKVATLKLDVQTVTKSRDHCLKENADLYNWRGAVTNKLSPSLVGNLSQGRALEILAEIMHQKCECDQWFRVKQWVDVKTKVNRLVVRYGTCYSFWGHFDIHWDDGEHQMGVAELSVFGIYKTGEEEARETLEGAQS